MKKYKQFLLENVYNNELNYFAFDWDDNILMMSTVVHLDHKIDGEWTPTDISTSEFAEIRKHLKDENSDWRFRNNDPEQTFIEFRDYGPRGENAFPQDSISAITKNDFGPSWNKFIHCLTHGNVFLIVTARGHEPETIRAAVEWIIFNFLNQTQRKQLETNLRKFNKLFSIEDKDKNFNELLDKYLDLCEFVGLTSSYFKRRYKHEGQTAMPELGKKIVVRDFVKRIHDYGKLINKKVNIGFSDDDLATIEHMHSFMRDELSLDFPVNYHVYYTKNGIKKIPF